MALCESCVQQQREIVATLTMQGQDATEAERLLQSLEETLALLRAQLEAEQRLDVAHAPESEAPRPRP